MSGMGPDSKPAARSSGDSWKQSSNTTSRPNRVDWHPSDSSFASKATRVLQQNSAACNAGRSANPPAAAARNHTHDPESWELDSDDNSQAARKAAPPSSAMAPVRRNEHGRGKEHISIVEHGASFIHSQEKCKKPSKKKSQMKELLQMLADQNAELDQMLNESKRREEGMKNEHESHMTDMAATHQSHNVQMEAKRDNRAASSFATPAALSRSLPVPMPKDSVVANDRKAAPRGLPVECLINGDSHYSKAPSHEKKQMIAILSSLSNKRFSSNIRSHPMDPSIENASGNDMSRESASFHLADDNMEAAIEGQFDDAEDDDMDQIMIQNALLLSKSDTAGTSTSWNDTLDDWLAADDVSDSYIESRRMVAQPDSPKASRAIYGVRNKSYAKSLPMAPPSINAASQDIIVIDDSDDDDDEGLNKNLSARKSAPSNRTKAFMHPINRGSAQSNALTGGMPKLAMDSHNEYDDDIRSELDDVVFECSDDIQTKNECPKAFAYGANQGYMFGEYASDKGASWSKPSRDASDRMVLASKAGVDGPENGSADDSNGAPFLEVRASNPRKPRGVVDKTARRRLRVGVDGSLLPRPQGRDIVAWFQTLTQQQIDILCCQKFGISIARLTAPCTTRLPHTEAEVQQYIADLRAGVLTNHNQKFDLDEHAPFGLVTLTKRKEVLPCSKEGFLILAYSAIEFAKKKHADDGKLPSMTVVKEYLDLKFHTNQLRMWTEFSVFYANVLNPIANGELANTPQVEHSSDLVTTGRRNISMGTVAAFSRDKHERFAHKEGIVKSAIIEAVATIPAQPSRSGKATKYHMVEAASQTKAHGIGNSRPHMATLDLTQTSRDAKKDGDSNVNESADAGIFSAPTTPAAWRAKILANRRARGSGNKLIELMATLSASTRALRSRDSPTTPKQCSSSGSFHGSTEEHEFEPSTLGSSREGRTPNDSDSAVIQRSDHGADAQNRARIASANERKTTMRIILEEPRQRAAAVGTVPHNDAEIPSHGEQITLQNQQIVNNRRTAEHKKPAADNIWQMYLDYDSDSEQED